MSVCAVKTVDSVITFNQCSNIHCNWEEAELSHLHIHFAGTCLGGKTFLIIVDAYSKWLEVLECKQMAESTITNLRQVFATHGLPEFIVSDDGPAFVSEQFSTFLSCNGIRHIKSALYHPSSNGLTERAVQKSHIPLPVRLSQFLFRCRITPHTSTRHTPAEMLMGRRLRSRLSLMLPNASRKIYLSQNYQKLGHTVFVRNVRNKTLAWLQGVSVSQTGPLSYKIELDNDCIISRHVDHIRYRSTDCDDSFDTIAPPQDNSSTASNPAGPSRSVESSPHQESPTIPRRSSRVRRPPDRH